MAEEKKDDGPVAPVEPEGQIARTPAEGGDGYDVNQPRYPAFDKEGNALGSMHCIVQGRRCKGKEWTRKR